MARFEEDIEIRVDADTTPAANKMKEFGTGILSSVTGLTAMNLAMGLGTLAGQKLSEAFNKISETIEESLKVYTEYEKQQAKISTLLQDTSKIDAYGQSLKTMSVVSGQSLGNLQKTFNDTISSGYNAADALKMTNEVIKAAIGGNSEAALVGDALTSTLNGMGLAADQTNRVLGIFQQTVLAGKTEMNNIAADLPKAIPLFKSLNVSVEQLANGYAVLTANGIRSEMAADRMNALAASLLDDKVIKNLKDAGVDWKAMNGNLNQFVNEISVLMGKKVNMSNIFPRIEAVQAIQTLAKDSAKMFNDSFQNNFNPSMIANAVDIAYAKMNATTALNADKVQAKWGVAMVNIGESLLGLKNFWLNISNSLAEYFMSAVDKIEIKAKEFDAAKSVSEGLSLVKGEIDKVINDTAGGVKIIDEEKAKASLENVSKSIALVKGISEGAAINIQNILANQGLGTVEKLKQVQAELEKVNKLAKIQQQQKGYELLETGNTAIKQQSTTISMGFGGMATAKATTPAEIQSQIDGLEKQRAGLKENDEEYVKISRRISDLTMQQSKLNNFVSEYAIKIAESGIPLNQIESQLSKLPSEYDEIKGIILEQVKAQITQKEVLDFQNKIATELAGKTDKEKDKAIEKLNLQKLEIDNQIELNAKKIKGLKTTQEEILVRSGLKGTVAGNLIEVENATKIKTIETENNKLKQESKIIEEAITQSKTKQVEIANKIVDTTKITKDQAAEEEKLLKMETENKLENIKTVYEAEMNSNSTTAEEKLALTIQFANDEMAIKLQALDEWLSIEREKNKDDKNKLLGLDKEYEQQKTKLKLDQQSKIQAQEIKTRNDIEKREEDARRKAAAEEKKREDEARRKAEAEAKRIEELAKKQRGADNEISLNKAKLTAETQYKEVEKGLEKGTISTKDAESQVNKIYSQMISSIHLQANSEEERIANSKKRDDLNLEKEKKILEIREKGRAIEEKRVEEYKKAMEGINDALLSFENPYEAKVKKINEDYVKNIEVIEKGQALEIAKKKKEIDDKVTTDLIEWKKKQIENQTEEEKKAYEERIKTYNVLLEKEKNIKKDIIRATESQKRQNTDYKSIEEQINSNVKYSMSDKGKYKGYVKEMANDEEKIFEALKKLKIAETNNDIAEIEKQRKIIENAKIDYNQKKEALERQGIKITETTVKTAENLLKKLDTQKEIKDKIKDPSEEGDEATKAKEKELKDKAEIDKKDVEANNTQRDREKAEQLKQFQMKQALFDEEAKLFKNEYEKQTDALKKAQEEETKLVETAEKQKQKQIEEEYNQRIEAAKKAGLYLPQLEDEKNEAIRKAKEEANKKDKELAEKHSEALLQLQTNKFKEAFDKMNAIVTTAMSVMDKAQKGDKIGAAEAGVGGAVSLISQAGPWGQIIGMIVSAISAIIFAGLRGNEEAEQRRQERIRKMTEDYQKRALTLAEQNNDLTKDMLSAIESEKQIIDNSKKLEVDLYTTAVEQKVLTEKQITETGNILNQAITNISGMSDKDLVKFQDALTTALGSTGALGGISSQYLNKETEKNQAKFDYLKIFGGQDVFKNAKPELANMSKEDYKKELQKSQGKGERGEDIYLSEGYIEKRVNAFEAWKKYVALQKESTDLVEQYKQKLRDLGLSEAEVTTVISKGFKTTADGYEELDNGFKNMQDELTTLTGRTQSFIDLKGQEKTLTKQAYDEQIAQQEHLSKIDASMGGITEEQRRLNELEIMQTRLKTLESEKKQFSQEYKDLQEKITAEMKKQNTASETALSLEMQKLKIAQAQAETIAKKSIEAGGKPSDTQLVAVESAYHQQLAQMAKEGYTTEQIAAAKAGFDESLKHLKGYSVGGFVNENIALAHKGEFVIPAGLVNSMKNSGFDFSSMRNFEFGSKNNSNQNNISSSNNIRNASSSSKVDIKTIPISISITNPNNLDEITKKVGAGMEKMVIKVFEKRGLNFNNLK